MDQAVLQLECRGRDPEALDAALRRAAQGRGFGVINTTDLRQKLADKGVAYAAAARVYDVCKPQVAAAVLQRQPLVAAVLPCRIALVEGEGRLRLVMLRPTALVAYFEPALLPQAREIEVQLEAMLAEAAQA